MIPVNIITGALVDLVRPRRYAPLVAAPPDERWAIVVNEFGALGIDGAVLDTAGGIVAGADGTTTTGGGDGGVVVREVAGGCLCCAVAAPFTVAVTQVLRRAKPDRLLIEPSGDGPSGWGLFDALSGEHFRGVLDLRATVALVDMTEVSSRGDVFHSEAFRDQVHRRGRRRGAPGPQQPEHETQFRRWAETLYPPDLRLRRRPRSTPARHARHRVRPTSTGSVLARARRDRVAALDSARRGPGSVAGAQPEPREPGSVLSARRAEARCRRASTGPRAHSRRLGRV